jgi:hypothetical protein
MTHFPVSFTVTQLGYSHYPRNLLMPPITDANRVVISKELTAVLALGVGLKVKWRYGVIGTILCSFPEVLSRWNVCMIVRDISIPDMNVNECFWVHLLLVPASNGVSSLLMTLVASDRQAAVRMPMDCADPNGHDWLGSHFGLVDTEVCGASCSV